MSPATTITLDYDLPHPPEKVWRALTERELVSAWLMKNDMQARVGQSFQFTHEPTPWWDGIVRCEVLEADAPRRLSYTWRSGSGATGLDTIVTWVLTPTATGTHLAFEHSGFKPENTFAADGARSGWERMHGEALVALLASR